MGDTMTVLRNGQFLSAPAGQIHTFRTLTVDARFLVMTSGHRASAFFADLATTMPPGPPTPATLPSLIDVAVRHGLSSPLFG